jgi:hypothetical protein
LAALGVAFALAAGCQNRQDARVNGVNFRPEGETRALHRFNDVQAAAGARTDGTLRAYHFDRGELNSLGQRKLDQMLKDDDAAMPLAVYLDMPQDEDYAARADAVGVYLKDRGLPESRVKVTAGPNTKNVGPTGPGLRAKKLLDGGATIAVNPEPAGSPGGMGGH